jgi:hypothetical protein
MGLFRRKRKDDRVWIQLTVPSVLRVPMPDSVILTTYTEQLGQLNQLAFRTASGLPAQSGSALGSALVARWWPDPVDPRVMEAIRRGVRLGLAFAEIEEAQDTAQGYVHPWVRECICLVSDRLVPDELSGVENLGWQTRLFGTSGVLLRPGPG